jgi:hypothetical protein
VSEGLIVAAALLIFAAAAMVYAAAAMDSWWKGALLWIAAFGIAALLAFVIVRSAGGI